jgi:hypothetical protein
MSRRCQHRTLVGRELCCWRPSVPVVGLCVNHAIEGALAWARFEWSWRTFQANLDLTNINRLHLSIDEDRPVQYVSLSWGNAYSDPVWSIGWQRRRD